MFVSLKMTKLIATIIIFIYIDDIQYILIHGYMDIFLYTVVPI